MEEVQNIIAEIQAKTGKIKASLVNVKSENDALKAELKVLTDKISQRELDILDFKQKYENLKDQGEQVMVANNNDHQEEREAQIDALVWEIEDCISRLKAE